MTEAQHNQLAAARAAAGRIRDAFFGRFGVQAVGTLHHGVVVTTDAADPADRAALRSHLAAAAAATGVAVELRHEPAFAA